MTRPLRIGTRGSALALIQARWVAARLARLDIPSELVIVRTEGDDRPIDVAWGEGAFVGRIVEALLAGSVDVAVHSAKDVPTEEHPDLVMAAYPEREDPRDALVCRVRGRTLATLPAGARIGTDSLRRAAFVRARRPDLQLHPLHGNVDTRLAKLDRGESDALVLAAAGLARLGRIDRIDEVLAEEIVLPAPGQGALAVQVRADDGEAIAAVAQLDDPATRIAVMAERRLLRATGGGCRSPIGALGRLEGDRFHLLAGAERSGSPHPDAAIPRSPIVRLHASGAPQTWERLAERLAARIVRLRERPRVLVTRRAEQAGKLLAALEREGLEAVNVPAIEVRPVEPGGPLDEALAAAPSGTWVVITSANAAAAASASIERLGISPGTLRWAAVGAATAAALRQGGITDPFLPSAPTGLALGDELPVAPGDRAVLPKGDAADGRLAETLASRGVHVEEVLAYRTIEAPATSRALLVSALDDGPVDAVVLTSGSTARGILALAADDDVRERLRRMPALAIGEPTARVAREQGFRSTLVAPASDADSLAVFAAAAFGLGRTPVAAGGIR